jgi:excisionase family DNA binding protein
MRKAEVLVTPTTLYDDLPQFLTMKQAASYLQLSYWSIQQAVFEGRIPHRKFSQKLKLIPREYFEKHAEEGKAGALAEALPFAEVR